MTQPVREELLLGTRASALALWQAEHVSKMLREASSGVCARPFPLSTLGDRSLDAALSDLGGASFSSEIDQALLGRRVRVAVHSLKDLPIQDNAGIVTAAILSREDPRDALVSSKKGGLAQLGLQKCTGRPKRNNPEPVAAPAGPVTPMDAISGTLGSFLAKDAWQQAPAQGTGIASLPQAGIERADPPRAEPGLRQLRALRHFRTSALRTASDARLVYLKHFHRSRYNKIRI